jgi:molecular chaperone DnaJ
VIDLAGNKRDYYEVLELSKDCSSSEIKASYRRLARQYHPDVNNGNPESEEKFKEISEAYAVLSNPDKRRQYDTYGFSGNLFDGINFESVFSEFGFGDIFDMFFGSAFGGGFSSRTRSRRKSRGSDIILETKIDFKESAFGVKKEIDYNLNVDCDHCQGTGAESTDGIQDCSVCDGTGQVRVSRNTFLGSLITTSTCNNCNGKGTVIKDPCKKCSGRGYVRKKRKITVDIPAGINNGDQLRLPGKGNSRGGDSIHGDLIVTVRVKPHPTIKRDRDDTVSKVDISFAQAALGTGMEIETLDGMEEILIKPGTQPGSKIVLKSKGFNPLNGLRRGDHIIYINVNIPSNLSPDEVSILKKYAEGRKEIVGDGSTGFFSNLKNAFKK